MNGRPTAPAELPPAGIVGLDPAWSRLVTAPDSGGIDRTWHLLDTWACRLEGSKPELTLLCVHGNPSWSFLWRDLLRQVECFASERVRVIAVDQLDMGFSERTGVKRTLVVRVDDLCRLTETLGIQGPVITVAHDWGGPISLGWALRHLPEQGADKSPENRSAISSTTNVVRLAGVVLTNTAVHQPAGSPSPLLIRLTRSRLMLRPATVLTGAFIQGAIEMSRPRLSKQVRAGFHAPYQKPSRRSAIADFVADIPLDPNHESASALDGIAAGLTDLTGMPVLLLWGPRDKVFSDLYLHDLEARLPHADVHRFPEAAHFVTEDADVAGAIIAWLGQLTDRASAADTDVRIDADAEANADSGVETVNTRNKGDSLVGRAPLTGRNGRRALADFNVAEPTTQAVVENAPVSRAITFGELSQRTEQLAAGMAAFGIRTGDRIAVMVTPGVDLALAVYGCWRLGATLVLVDSGLGRVGMQAALLSANPAFLIGIDKALIASKILRWPGQRIAVGTRSAVLTRALNIVSDLDSLAALGEQQTPPPLPSPETVAAVAFTSGSTGPSKGVIYRHRQIQAQRDALMSLYEITTADRLVAAFAPFALYGPTMGITSLVPDMDVTAPGTLTAQALVDAVDLIDASLVFASPAALVNVVATLESTQACNDVRLVLSAGAPVRAELLRAAASLFAKADFHTPYGMTEMLPVADISLAELAEIRDSSEGLVNCLGRDNDDGAGVCVGYPLPNVEIFIDPLDRHGKPAGQSFGKPFGKSFGEPLDNRRGQVLEDSSETSVEAFSSDPGTLGEIIVRAAHGRDGYDRLWFTEHRASQPDGWHRTGDIGELDSVGRLWVGGRLGHVITTPAGPLAPVASEQRIETLDEVGLAAVVGVGPNGAQAIVAVLQIADNAHPTGEASLDMIDRVRQVVSDAIDVVAVLIVRKLPVDRRHNSKVDRSAVAHWASRVLAGERVRAL